MKQSYANGRSMAQILGLMKPRIGEGETYGLRILTLLIFVSMCLLNSAQAQSRLPVGAADGRKGGIISLTLEKYKDFVKGRFSFDDVDRDGIKNEDRNAVHQLEGFVEIKYEGSPLKEAKVSFPAEGVYVFTDTNGKFELPVRAAFGVIEITMEGFAKAQIPFDDGSFHRTRNRFPLLAVQSEAMILNIGDTIPDQLWDLPIRVVNYRGGRTVVSLREFAHKNLIVLDFWAKWCAPCVRSVESWERYKSIYGDDLALLPVQLDLEGRALPFVVDRGWTSPVVVGKDASIVNSYFFSTEQLSRSVWIVDGKLFAITGTAGGYEDTLSDLFVGKQLDRGYNLASHYSFGR